MRRPTLCLLVAASVVTIGGCQDSRVPQLEKQITELEARVKNLEQQQQAIEHAESQNDARFKQCVYSADDEFDKALRLNGTKNSNGSYAVPTSSLQEIQRQKQNRLEECKLLYK